MVDTCRSCNKKLTRYNKRPNRGVCKKCEYKVRRNKIIKTYSPKNGHCIDCNISRDAGIFKRIQGARCIPCFRKLTKRRYLEKYYRKHIPIRYKKRTSKIICNSIYQHFFQKDRLTRKFVIPVVFYMLV